MKINLIILLLIPLSACAGLVPPTWTPFPPTPTITVTTTMTVTPVWFPPTHTPTSQPPTTTPLPTQEMHPERGEIILQDDFSNKSRWQTSNNNMGSAAYGEKELTLAVKQPRWTVFSLIQIPFPPDYYLEISTTSSLCQDGDSYGLLLRAESERDAYRYVINCDGQVRLELVTGGTAAPVQDWTLSGQVRAGAPQVLRLGVWAVGNEMRFFISSVYQFSAYRVIWNSGSLGVFARAASDTGVTVSFSDLVVRQGVSFPPTYTPSPSPTATLTPTFKAP